MTQIKSQEQLDNLIMQNINKGEGMLDCFVLLNGGLRSSKSITFSGNDSYEVLNEIDDTTEIIEHNKLISSFPIGEAIQKGAFYAY